MISTLEYRAGNDVKAFFEDAQHLLLRDNTAHLVLESGDATRYELTIVELPGEHKTQVMCFTGGGFAREVGFRSYVHPGYMGEGLRVNEHTLHLVAEVLNSLAGLEDSGFYSWTERRALVE